MSLINIRLSCRRRVASIPRYTIMKRVTYWAKLRRRKFYNLSSGSPFEGIFSSLLCPSLHSSSHPSAVNSYLLSCELPQDQHGRCLFPLGLACYCLQHLAPRREWSNRLPVRRRGGRKRQHGYACRILRQYMPRNAETIEGQGSFRGARQTLLPSGTWRLDELARFE